MNGTIVCPLPSRRVLDELGPFRPRPGRGASAVAAAFVDLDRVLAAHALALLAMDRAEAGLAAARASADAAWAVRLQPRTAAADDRGGSVPGPRRTWPAARTASARRGHGVGSKRRAFMVRHARQLRLDRRGRDLAARLLSTPAAGLDDIALKLAVIIAAGEAGPPDAAAFPWFRLRRILTELPVIATAGA